MEATNSHNVSLVNAILVLLIVVTSPFFPLLSEVHADNFTPLLPISKLQGTSKYKYSKILNLAIGKVLKGDSITPEMIQKIIPKNDSEFILYYSYFDVCSDYPKRNEALEKLDELIYCFARENTTDIFELVLNMGEFVDGEYAEHYLSHIYFISAKHPYVLCETYLTLGPWAQQLFSDLYAFYCGKQSQESPVIIFRNIK